MHIYNLTFIFPQKFNINIQKCATNGLFVLDSSRPKGLISNVAKQYTGKAKHQQQSGTTLFHYYYNNKMKRLFKQMKAYKCVWNFLAISLE